MIPSEFKLVRKTDLKMTQVELARALGCSVDTVSVLERSTRPIPKVYELALLHLVWESKVRPMILDLMV